MNSYHVLINWHLGAAIYTMPSTFQKEGNLTSVAVMSVCMGLTYCVYYLLIKSAQTHNIWSFEGLIHKTLSPVWSKVISVLIVVNAIGVFGSYDNVIRSIGDQLGVPPVVYGALLILVTVLSCTDEAWNIPFANEIANFALIVLIGGILYIGSWSDLTIEALIGQGSSAEPMINGQLTQLARTFNIFVFSFSSAEVILTFHRIVPPSKMLNFGLISCLISMSIYIVTGLSGAVLFPNVQDDILDNFNQTDSFVVATIVLLVNLLSILLSIPVFIITARQYLKSTLQINPNRMTDNVLSVGLVILALVVGRALPFLSDCIIFVSGFTDCLFMLVFPPLIAFYSLKMSLKEQAISCGLFSLGLALFFMTLFPYIAKIF